MFKITKTHKVMLITLGITIVIVGYGFFRTITSISTYTKGIGVNLPKDSTIIMDGDSHGGFHGDGEYYSEIQLTDDGIKKFSNNANKTGEWFPTPLPKDIEIILHGGEYEGINYNIGNKSKNIPKDIKNGIYYVRDRFAESNSNMKNKNILSRNSFNVTVSILDFETKKLYVYKLDT